MSADPFDLTGQVAVVVGAAAGGLGERAVLALAGRGARVVAADVAARKDDLATTAERAPGTGTAECDVTDEASVEALFDDVLARHGRLDVLVNAAGVMLRKGYDETTLEEFERVVRVNLTGTWLLGRAAGRRMAALGAGRIVNLTTVYAERVGPVPESAYYASKAGVVNVTRALAAELGPSGVTVNCLAPAVFYPTAMTAPLAADPERLEWFAARTMLGRLGDPERDLDGPLLLLASPASAYVTGQVVYVDGGWSAW
ncbi:MULTISPECIES: SDR family NAD(P)-dependent oxidoreductase [unclassified Geodermatophilus]|uniref:SDR family NAD(P)-dependent oxidoreductase n=1 Tax=unclassified Geodermatophilus TaxID=2637632 RepID=UPI003EE896FD